MMEFIAFVVNSRLGVRRNNEAGRKEPMWSKKILRIRLRTLLRKNVSHLKAVKSKEIGNAR